MSSLRSPRRVAIVGAGIAGLAAAWQIHRESPDIHVDIFEATDRIGGKLLTIEGELSALDMGAEAFIARRQDMLDLVEDLGLTDRLVYSSLTTSRMYVGGQLRGFPPAGMMGIPVTPDGLEDYLTKETLARITCESNPSVTPPMQWSVGSDVSIGGLVRERYGDDVADRLVDSMLGGIYSAHADDVGLRAALPGLAAQFDQMAAAGEPVSVSGAIKQMLAARTAPPAHGAPPKTASSGEGASAPARKPTFATLVGGFADIYEALAEQSGADIYVDSFVTGISGDSATGFTVDGVSAQDDQGNSVRHTYDRVIVATPAPTAARLLRTVSPEAAGALANQHVANSVVVSLRIQLDDGVPVPEYSGALVATGEPDVHAKAFTLTSNKWPHLASKLPSGQVLVRCSFGYFGDDTYPKMDPEELTELALEDFDTVFGIRGEIVEAYVQTWFGGLPVYGVGHNDLVATVLEALPERLSVTGAWVDGVGVPAVITHARRIASEAVAPGSVPLPADVK
ncbi:MAG: protoporphyrinogen oxidase [Corynebacterium sp.]|nr:protoporphyrinogen oxidase [Corynebacterium sp.]